MEASGVVFRPIPSYSGAGIWKNSEVHFNKSSLSGLCVAGNRFSGKLSLVVSSRDSGISVRSRKFSGLPEFSDEGHLMYYGVAPRCGGKKKEKVKEKDSEAAMVKRRMKLIKGLSRDLSAFNTMGFGAEIGDDLIGQANGKTISEAADAILAQLRQLRAEEKEMKRRRKEEKTALKAARVKAMADNDTSSSSSSESSDSECEEVVVMSRLRSGALAEPKIDDQQRSIPAEASIAVYSSTIERNTAPSSSTTEEQNMAQAISSSISSCRNRTLVSASAKRVEVCMGGKCKKSGAVELFEKFERTVGVEGTVVGCKCMGKCRDGPNVRVLNLCNEKEEGYVSPITNPLCIGVGLEDVGVIVANFCEEKKDMGLLAT